MPYLTLGQDSPLRLMENNRCGFGCGRELSFSSSYNFIMAYIKSFKDLIVYQDSYVLSKQVINYIISNLPNKEKYDLSSQLLRSAKAMPRLIAEGYAKKHQPKGFRRYLDDALAECNETIVGLEQCKDFYSKDINCNLCSDLIKRYDILARQIYKLAKSWENFSISKTKT